MVMRHADLVGKKITAKGGLEFHVTGHNGEVKHASRLLLKCPRCEKDPELFGSGEFWAIPNDVRRGHLPCGCAKSPRYTERQYQVLCKRAAEKKGLAFSGFLGEFKNNKTKTILSCKKHGVFKTKNINMLLNSESGCPKCGRVKSSTGSRITYDKVNSFFKKCGYQDGSIIYYHYDDFNLTHSVKIYCAKCGKDEFAQAGLCNGVFESSIESIRSGGKSCRCVKGRRKTKEIVEAQCASALKEIGVDFIGFPNGYHGSKSRVHCRCHNHGDYFTIIETVLTGHGCPSCSPGGYSVNKDGFVYLLKSRCGKYLKPGITNNPEKRISDLTSFTPFDFDVIGVKEMQGQAAPVFERKLLAISPRAGLSGFNGSSEWVEFDNSLIDAFFA